MSYFTLTFLAKNVKSCVYFTLTAHLGSGWPCGWRLLHWPAVPLKALNSPVLSSDVNMCLRGTFFPLCRESILFSQQLAGVSVMPSCVGCSVRILFCKQYNNFQELSLFVVVFLVATREV